MTPNINSQKQKFPLWSRVRIDIHSYCNRNCHFCPRYHDRSGIRKDAHGTSIKERMPTSKVYDLIEEISSYNFKKYIGFHRLSEPLLDSRFLGFCRFAKNKDMLIRENTNGDVLKKNPELCYDIDGLVDILVIGIYDYDSEAEKIEQMEFFKKYFRKTTILFSTPNETLKIRQYSRVYSTNTKYKGILEHPCYRPKILLIRYDGNVSLCCEDDQCNFSLGNVFHQSLAEIWWSDKHVEIASALRKKGGRHKYKLCSNCYLKGFKDIPILTMKKLQELMQKTEQKSENRKIIA